jgi:hypothetical protein
MSEALAKQSEIAEAKPARSNVWTWVTIGVGTGLLVTVAAGLGYHYLEAQRRSKDPRAQKVKDLIEEAERLLAQGKKANHQRRKEEPARATASSDKDGGVA